MQYIVYKTTNIHTGHYYIGVHGIKNDYDEYYGSGKRLKYALKKYGKNSFNRIILFTFDTSKDAYLKEAELVTEKTLKDPLCYNFKVGGQDGTGQFREKNPFWGKTHSVETKKLLAKISSERLKKKPLPSRKGILWTEEQKQRLKDASTLRGKPRSQEFKDNIRQKALKRWSNPENRKKHSESVKLGKLAKKQQREQNGSS